jgi:UDP-N-acetylmuramate--alanine ligase
MSTLGKTRSLHFVGIGGIGMSGIAEVLVNLGYEVTGSDLKLTDVTERLSRLGVSVAEGHAPGNVSGADVVVISSAVDEENDEVREARRLKVPVIRRAEMLAELMRMKRGVAIAGTHGKTTTTSIVGQVLVEGGLDPTIVVGGVVTAADTNAVLGSGEYIVVEADEFDRSFLKLTPTIAVVTTLELDHTDCYKDVASVESAFTEFANKVPFYGRVIACIDDSGVQRLMPQLDVPLTTYGVSSPADVTARDVTPNRLRTGFSVRSRERGDLGRILLRLPGVHNVQNALAAVAVGLELEIEWEDIVRAVESFTGVRRRFEVAGEARGVTVVDDYAHHPTEIAATLAAARSGFDARVVAVFQPHLFTRTRDFAEEFGRSLLGSDVAVITGIYPAREKPIEGVTGELVASAARESGHRDVHWVQDKTKLPNYLYDLVRAGDIVITLGAGDIWKVGRSLLSRLEGGEG